MMEWANETITKGLALYLCFISLLLGGAIVKIYYDLQKDKK